MSMWDRLRGRKTTTDPAALLGPNTASPTTDLGPMVFGGAHAGVAVDAERALGVAAVYAAVARIAGDVATLPLWLYDQADGRRRRATWRPEWELMARQPNQYQTAVQFRQAMVASALLWGDAYAEIQRNANGQPIGLHFIEPHRVRPRLNLDQRVVEYVVDGGALGAGSVLHWSALSTNGATGRGVVAQAREAIGLSIAAERYGARFFGNGARPGGVLQTDKRIGDPAAVERLRETWNATHQGPSNAGGVAVLEDGMKYQPIGLPPEDSQFLQTRQFQVQEIARWFGLPPAMLGVTEGSSQYKNLHEQITYYAKFTLRPWLETIEAALNAQLIAPALRSALYWEHDLDALMRADLETRYRTYEMGLRNGWLSVNEVRARENLDPIPGGDTYGTTGGGADE